MQMATFCFMEVPGEAMVVHGDCKGEKGARTHVYMHVHMAPFLSLQ